MKKMILALTLIVAFASVAGAQTVLWDQSQGYETWEMGFFNMAAGSFPFGMTAYTCNDVTVAGGWIVDSITVYYDGFDWSWDGAISTATLFVENKTGSLPTSDPSSTGTSVSATCGYLGNGFMYVTASGLNLNLAAGDYWIGLTPDAPSADNIHVSVPALGDDSPTYDTGGFPMPMWGAWNAGLDGAMKIEGTASVADESVSFGEIKALFR